jgi:hypothetical protein
VKHGDDIQDIIHELLSRATQRPVLHQGDREFIIVADEFSLQGGATNHSTEAARFPPPGFHVMPAQPPRRPLYTEQAFSSPDPG